MGKPEVDSSGVVPWNARGARQSPMAEDGLRDAPASDEDDTVEYDVDHNVSCDTCRECHDGDPQNCHFL